jgi:peptidoglycan hydrolase CwlO-like protein
VKTYRVLTLLMGLLALIGWGAFAYAAKSAAGAQARQEEMDQLRQEMTQIRDNQEQLVAERDQARTQAAQLLAERDEARAQLATAQQEIAALQKRLEEAQAKLLKPNTETPARSERPASSPARTNKKRR